MAALELCNVRKSYVQANGDRLEILRDVNLRIERGSSTSIVGQSGTGKSTLLHIMGLMDSPDSGEVRVAGSPTNEMSQAERSAFRGNELGFVFQHFYLLNRRSVLQNVMEPLFWGDHSSMSQRSDQAEHFIRRVGLEHRILAYPHTLSGGERQRVAIARALVREPSVLLADEPTGNLDVRTSHSIAEILFETTAHSATALVLVTHDLSLANLAQESFILQDGRLHRDES